jgi:hypothetical protein
MTERVLIRRELNRALLARQMLLERARLSVTEAVGRLIGLQSQIPNPPYIGLWTRLHDFARDDLTRQMEQRQIVRAAMMRSTLHLVTRDDHQRFRGAIYPALMRALSAFFGDRARGLDIDRLVETARVILDEQPRSNGEIGKLLLEVEPGRDPNALAYAVRTHLPLVQVPPGGTWGKGSTATYVTAESWFGAPDAGDLGGLFRRYLAAYGPASVMDFQVWTGMTKLKEAVEPLKAGLVTYRDENGVELFDLPDQLLPADDTPAPVRFIPEYDNLLIAHNDRTRIIADEDRPKVFLSAGRVQATILVDGFVRGTWKIEKAKKAAALVIEPFEPLSAAVSEALRVEGERLARFIEDRAETVEVRFNGA